MRYVETTRLVKWPEILGKTTLLKQGGFTQGKSVSHSHLVEKNPPCCLKIVNNKQGGCKFFFTAFQNDPNKTTLSKQGGTV